MSYNISNVLAAYYEDKLQAELSLTNGVPPKLTACFDEWVIK